MDVPSHGPIRLVAIDLDGTVLDDSKQVSRQTFEGLACAAESGARIVIASARPPRTVRHIYRMLKLETWQINYNGALIWDEPAGRVVRHYPIAPQTARRVIEHARRLFPDVLVSCEIQDRWLTDRPDHSHTTETGEVIQAGSDHEYCGYVCRAGYQGFASWAADDDVGVAGGDRRFASGDSCGAE